MSFFVGRKRKKLQQKRKKKRKDQKSENEEQTRKGKNRSLEINIFEQIKIIKSQQAKEGWTKKVPEE